jgi:hypothetical protein
MQFSAHNLAYARKWREPERSARFDTNECFHHACECARGGFNDARERGENRRAGDAWPE